MQPVTLQTLQRRKQAGERFACLTSYDAALASAASRAGVEALLVGDSLGMVLQGADSTLAVTMDAMAYHTGCVSAGHEGALVIADMPFMSYATQAEAMANAARLMRAGAHLVKLEGGEWLSETVHLLHQRNVPVCAHLGLQPQAVHQLGGYRVQGRDSAEAQRIVQDALALEQAGASLLVLECVPTSLANTITEKLAIPVIGIGAGNGCDGQVLVVHDMLGLGPERPPRFVKNFMAESGDGIPGALRAYVDAVKSGAFPGPEHSF